MISVGGFIRFASLLLLALALPFVLALRLVLFVLGLVLGALFALREHRVRERLDMLDCRFERSRQNSGSD